MAIDMGTFLVLVTAVAELKGIGRAQVEIQAAKEIAAAVGTEDT